jgi:tight adherence protein B
VGVGGKMENWFARLLHECGAPFSRDVAFMTEIAGGLLVGGVIFVWFESVPLAALGFFIGMGLVIGLYVLARNRRQTIMREQLPDAIEHLARAVRAGQTIDQALTLVGETTPQPLGLEFRRCAAQLEMGLSVDAAVRALSRRVPVPEMRILASTFIVQRRAGGNLPLTLERLAKVVRDRLSYFRQFRAATAGSRMSLLIVSLTGPFVAGYMMIYRPESFDLFFQSSLGWILFSTALALYFVGLAWIYRLLRHNY